MNIYEIDWQISSVRRIVEALSQGIAVVNYDLEMSQTPNEPTYGTYDAEAALEHIDNLSGIAFVTAQTYITGTVSDIPKLTKLQFRPTKRELLQNFGNRLSGYAITDLELCDAAANYWKHHDEWDGWLATDRNKRTIEILNGVGIGEKDYSPCYKAGTILWPNAPLVMNELPNLLSSWRQKVIEAYKPKRE